MKKAEDFREAFGQAEEGFERAVRRTLNELALREGKRPAFRRPRFLVPVIAAVLVMALGIGLAAGGRWGVLDWLRENRPVAEATPVPEGTEAPFAEPVDSKYVTVTVREVRSDGFGLYLSVQFTPREKDVLVYNWGLNPFRDGPEAMGIEPDEAGQTLVKWALSHGYSKLVRVALFSRNVTFPEGTDSIEDMEAYLTEQGIPYRKASDGNIITDRVSYGEGIDSVNNNTAVLEEDGSTLVMAAGGYVSGREDYTLLWTAAPCLMKEGGEPWSWLEDNVDMNDWSQGTIPLRIPAVTAEPRILAEYAGQTPAKADPERTFPVTVQLLRTDLNDYYVIRSGDPDRNFLYPFLYPEDRDVPGTAGVDRFAGSGIYSLSAQEEDGQLRFTVACRLPEDLPDRLFIRWMDSQTYVDEATLIERTDR